MIRHYLLGLGLLTTLLCARLLVREPTPVRARLASSAVRRLGEESTVTAALSLIG